MTLLIPVSPVRPNLDPTFKILMNTYKNLNFDNPIENFDLLSPVPPNFLPKLCLNFYEN